MSALDLLRSRTALAYGVGITTRRNKVLGATSNPSHIAARVGRGKPSKDAPAAIEVVEDRTFVFSLLGGTVGTLANRIGSSTALRVLRSNLVIAATSYFVGGFKSVASKWRDVWRLDKAAYSIGGAAPVALTGTQTSFRINGSIDNAVATPVAYNYGRSSLPFVCPPGGPYQGAATGDSTRSTLFIGMSNGVNIGVASLSKSGTEMLFTKPADFTYYGQKTTAGLSVTPIGEFLVIGGLISMYAGNSPQYCWSVWSKIQVSSISPFSVITNNGMLRLNDTWEFPVSTAPYSVTSGVFSRFIPTPLWRKTIGGTFVELVGTFSPTGGVSYYNWGHWIKNAADVREYTTGVTTGTKSIVSGDVFIDDSFSAYVGSGFDMTATRSVRGAFNHSGGWGSTSVCSYYGHVLSSSQEVTTKVHLDALQLRRLLSIEVIVSKNGRFDSGRINIEGAEQGDGSGGEYWKNVIGNPFSETPEQLALRNANATSSYEEGSSQDWTYQASPNVTLGTVNIDEMIFSTDLLATTVDYIFVDVINEIFITLESEFSFHDSRNTTSVGSTTYHLVLKYRLQWRGVAYDFPVYDGASLAQLPVVFLETLTPIVPAADGASANYYRGARPTFMFCPPFMSQGNCPYIAYTTKAEELEGAIPEIYVDFSLLAMPVASSAQTEASRYAGTTIFGPVQFSTIFQRFICGESMTTHQVTRNSTAWTALLFPAPTRIQFANGVIGPWQSALGSAFSSNPAVEITRI